ncbi:MAG: peroxiredoxin [Candidatus Riflebacteria bacterium]|nr:peroxiredoxin [Candidatus Riflebacteria bacterium]
MSLVLQKAPHFTAGVYVKGGDVTKDTFSLADRKGKWTVLFFYPLDFTFVCPTELRSLAERHEQFKKLGAEIVAVSVDSVFTHKAWYEKDLNDVKYPVVADLTKQISKDYGVLNESTGFALRGAFIVDPEGTVVYEVVSSPAIGRNTDEVLRALQAAQTGELCPVNWKPGDKTIK